MSAKRSVHSFNHIHMHCLDFCNQQVCALHSAQGIGKTTSLEEKIRLATVTVRMNGSFYYTLSETVDAKIVEVEHSIVKCIDHLLSIENYLTCLIQLKIELELLCISMELFVEFNQKYCKHFESVDKTDMAVLVFRSSQDLQAQCDPAILEREANNKIYYCESLLEKLETRIDNLRRINMMTMKKQQKQAEGRTILEVLSSNNSGETHRRVAKKKRFKSSKQSFHKYTLEKIVQLSVIIEDSEAEEAEMQADLELEKTIMLSSQKDEDIGYLFTYTSDEEDDEKRTEKQKNGRRNRKGRKRMCTVL